MMIQNRKTFAAGLSLATLGIFLASSPTTLAQGGGTTRIYAGSVIPTKLDRELKSDKNFKGDNFTVTVTGDGGSTSGLPNGTKIDGIVTEAHPKDGNNPGVLDISFRRIHTPDGRAYSITGSAISLDSKSVDHRSDGRIVAKASKRNNRLTYVGYGAGAGLLASVISGGKLHLENVALGAGLGFLAGSLEKNRAHANNVDLKVGTSIGVRIDQNVSVARR